MARGEGKARWAPMAKMLALTYNIHRDKKRSRPKTPADFNPYMDKSDKPHHTVITSENADILRDAMTGKDGKK